eukprot:g19359.t1
MDSSLPKILELRYCRSFPGEHFRWVTRWAMSRNGHPTETDTAEAFNALYRDDCYTLGYHPAQGECGRVSLQLNGTELGAVEGRSFSEAIFSDHRPFYLLAVQEWTARMCPTSGEDNTAKGHAKAAPLICIPSRHPLFFTWVEDPVGEVTKYYEQALWRFKMDVVVFLTMDIFIALGVLLCLKELGFK